VESARQWPAIESVARCADSMKRVDGIVLVGSFAAGSADELSDVDIWVVAAPGQLAVAWRNRHELAQEAFATWEDASRGSFKWLTRDVVKVDCTVLDPAEAMVELAEPSVVLVGEPTLVDRFARVAHEVVEQRAAARAERQRDFDPAAMTDGETVDWASSELKNALRRLRRP